MNIENIAVNESAHLIEVDQMSPEQLYQRLSEGFDNIAIHSMPEK